METRANHIAIGVFVLIALAGIAAVVLWLAGGRLERPIKLYDIFFRGSVNGLYEGAPVRYKGFPIGHVLNIRLDPKNIERIRVRIAADVAVPIKQDAVASIESEGVTGQSVVQIAGGSNASPLLVRRGDQPYPVIASQPSRFEEVVTSAPELFFKATAVADRLAALLSDRNMAAATQVLGNLATLSGALAAHASDVGTLMGNAAATSAELRKTAARAKQLMDELDRSVNAPDGVAGKLNLTLDEFNDSAKALNKMTTDFDDVIQDNRGALRDFSQRGLTQTEQLVTDARRLVDQLTRIADDLQRDPARFLFGNERQGYQPR